MAGLNTVVEVDYSKPDVKLDLWGGRWYVRRPRAFGRVIDHRWVDYGPDPDVDTARIQYGYDSNSNHLWRQNNVGKMAAEGSVGGPNLYQYFGGRPIIRIDPFGLIDICLGPDGNVEQDVVLGSMRVNQMS